MPTRGCSRSLSESVALELRPRCSRLLERWVLAIHAAGAAAVFATALSNDARAWALPGVVAVSLWWAWRTCLRGQSGGELQRLVWNTDGTWLLTDRRGNVWRARLLATSYLHPHLLVLRFRAVRHWRRFNAVLCRDSERASALRTLRRRLAIERYRQSSA